MILERWPCYVGNLSSVDLFKKWGHVCVLHCYRQQYNCKCEYLLTLKLPINEEKNYEIQKYFVSENKLSFFNTVHKLMLLERSFFYEYQTVTLMRANVDLMHPALKPT